MIEMRKLTKKEIESVQKWMELPLAIRWMKCPFYDINPIHRGFIEYRKSPKCHNICAKAFPRIAGNWVVFFCPCGAYSRKYVRSKTRKIVTDQLLGS